MAVETFECQIARGQINRFLAGENFSREGMRQLEEHVATCEGCKAALSQRKQALHQMLGATSPAPIAAVSMEAPIEITNTKVEIPVVAPADQLMRNEAVAQLKTAVKSAKATASETSRGSFTKPLIYVSALAVVLIGMSYAMRSGAILGSKATETVPLQPIANSAISPMAKTGTPKVQTATVAPSATGTAVGKAFDELQTQSESAKKAGIEKPAAEKTAVATKSVDNESDDEADVTPPVKKASPRLHNVRRATSKTKIFNVSRVRKSPVATKIARHRTPHTMANMARGTITIYDGNGRPVVENEG